MIDGGAQATSGAESVLADLFADPPLVHGGASGARDQLLHTDPDCYRFMAGVVRTDSRTLETGCGLSTAIFAALGTRHTAIFGSQGRLKRCLRGARDVVSPQIP